MQSLKSLSPSGILAGFAVVVATTIALSIPSPFIFSQLVRDGDMDVLMTSPGPLGYALLVLFASSAFGVFVCNKVANGARIINPILVVTLYAAFSFWLSTTPSNQDNPYPQWYVILSYVLLAPGAWVGHRIFSRTDETHKQPR